MLKKITTTVSLLICMTFLAVNAWGFDLQDGKYEITSKIDIQGMPMQTPPVTITQCLTQQDPVPNQSTDDQQCKIIEMKTEGKTVTWKMECTQQGQKAKHPERHSVENIKRSSTFGVQGSTLKAQRA